MKDIFEMMKNLHGQVSIFEDMKRAGVFNAANAISEHSHMRDLIGIGSINQLAAAGAFRSVQDMAKEAGGLASILSSQESAMRDIAGLGSIDRLASVGAFAEQVKDIMNSAVDRGFHSLFDSEFQNDFFVENIDYSNILNDSFENTDATEEDKETLVRYILALIIAFIILNMSYFYQKFLDDIDAYSLLKNKSNELISKAYIKKEAKIISGRLQPELLQTKRFVIAGELHVREKPRQSSKSIYVLKLGYIVEVIGQDRNWIKIRFSDNDGHVIEGWSYTRYLKKFK